MQPSRWIPVLLVIGFAGPGPVPAGTLEELMELSHTYWETVLEFNPESATYNGDRRYDHRLEDNSPEGQARETQRYQEMLRQAEALDPESLSQNDRITHTALLFDIRSRIARAECGLSQWTVDPLQGPHVRFFNLASYQPLDSPESGQALRQRWEAMGPYVDQHVANLRSGLGAGKVATQDAVNKVIEQINDLEAQPVEEWALLRPAFHPPEDWSAEERESFTRDLRRSVIEDFRPALLRYRDCLVTEILPEARSQEEPGVMHVSDGKSCYEKMILNHTSLTLPAPEIHEIGLDEVARINNEMRALGEKVLGTGDLEEIHRRLREDPQLHFTTRDEVQEKAEEALRRAEAVMPEWFGILPQAPCRVVRMEAHEEKHSTIAYYMQPTMDGSRPGSYYINTYAPETRPRYEAEALAFHEAIPGHHLQIAIAQELKDMPEFRKHSGVTAYVEGWGLYTERLSNEMGLYTGDIDRFGMLSYDSWRACRLVVDTGMHALGWTRQQAIDYMIANTVLAENNIVNEVDRYIAWPGQALAYKLGQREIFRLRAEAQERLGDRFDIKGFHDAVLSQGAVDLGTLGLIVETWVASVEGAAD